LSVAADRASRVELARSQARRAKVAIALGGLAAFAVAVPLARLTYGSHSKPRVRPLDAPESFRRSVRRDLLSAGILAPAQAPPGAATAVS
jgi:hypothetical protein